MAETHRIAALSCMIALAGCGLILSLSLCACTRTNEGNTSDASATSSSLATNENSGDKDNADYWEQILASYAQDCSVNQILLVRYQGGSSALSQFYVKQPQSTVWTLVFEDNSDVGEDGVGEASEYISRTPAGDFAVLEAFGILDNPGTSLPYIQVTNTIYACNEDCAYYNSIVDTALLNHDCSGEHMIEIAPQYNYGLSFDYNPQRIYGLGSAFFVHCKGQDSCTSGCVALDQDHMKTLLQMAEPGARVVIGD